jgi:hypothetical protein
MGRAYFRLVSGYASTSVRDGINVASLFYWFNKNGAGGKSHSEEGV